MTSKLPVAARPKALVSWLRRKDTKLEEPPSFDVSVFANEMRKWWTSLMPKYRAPPVGSEAAKAKWPLQRTVPDGESWAKVRKTGPEGLVLVLLALSWWRSATNAGQAGRREYASVLDDVTWVVTDLVKDMVPFASRDRPALTSPFAPESSDPDPPTAITKTKRGRESRPSQKKLGSSGLSPTRASKRARRG